MRPIFIVLALLAAVPNQATEPKAGEEREFEIAEKVKVKFVWIPASKEKVKLGSPKEERESAKAELARRLGGKVPPAVIRMIDAEKEHDYEQKKGFWLAKYETTQAEWEALMQTTPFWFHKNGRGANAVAGLDTSRFPAEMISFDDIYGKGWNDGDQPKDGSFLAKVNARAGAAKVFGAAGKFRLPTEDEWEYAYRGGKGNKQPFYWGNALNADKANCGGLIPFGTDKRGKSLQRTSEVGSYEKVAKHPWGLCDMSGNLLEWCENLYASDQKTRTLRGGGWLDLPINCRAATRIGSPPDAHSYLGFRLCFSPD